MLESWYLRWAPSTVVETWNLPGQYTAMSTMLFIELFVFIVGLGLPALYFGLREQDAYPPNPTWDGDSRERELAKKRNTARWAV